jgi:long-chain acyl-CoA synthetase
MRRNLGELILEASTAFQDDVAYQVRRGFRLERLTFGEAGQRARQVAGWLAARGLQPGERVVVWSPNMPEYALLYFGAWLAGVVVVPIDVRTQQDVLNRFIAAAEPRLGFRSKHLETAFGPPVAETFSLEELFEMVDGIPPLEPLPDVGPDSLAEIAFTSGTTGVPKGVMLSHGNFLAEVDALRVGFPLKRTYRALSVLPLSHALEQVINLLLAYSFGVRITYVPRVNAVTIGRALREDKITCLVIVPELLRLMLSGIERRARQQGSWRRWQVAHRVAGRLPFAVRRLLFLQVHQAIGGQLQFFGCGGAPLDLKVASAWERMGVEVFEGYGLTETAAAATINNSKAKRLGSVGTPVPGIEVKIADGGEILVRGRSVTPGYFDNPELTAQAFTDGWFRSGDTGSIDSDGFLHISGRESFKIVLKDGRNVYPEDVERSLNQHPLVRESCVVGVERNGGESVHAVLLTDDAERAGEIVRETNRGLAAHQQIGGYTIWSEEDFPRTATLKVDRKLVRGAVEREQTRTDPAPPSEETEQPRDPLVGSIARAASRSPNDVEDEAELEGDLGLDSIGRVELLSAIEEDLGRVVDEAQVGPQTTVGELRTMVAEAGATEPMAAAARWPRAWWARWLRRLLLWVVFRLQDRWMRIEVVHPERAAGLPMPSLLIFNYEGPYVPLVMLRALPQHVRSRVALGADARLWDGRDRWQGWLAAVAAQAFPFVKTGGAVRRSLEELGRWLDDGYAVIMSPEGDPELGQGVLPFLPGTGLMAVEMQVPVVPFKVENYGALFPREPQFPYLPDKRGRARLIIGEPVTFPKTMSYQDATERARRALIETR